MQQQRDLVDVVGVDRRDHRALLDVGEQRDLAALVVRAAGPCSGTAARRAGCRCARSSFTECCVGLVLISPEVAMYGTSVRCMYSTLPWPSLDAELADGLEERQRLDVAHRAADLDHADVGVAGAELDASA